MKKIILGVIVLMVVGMFLYKFSKKVNLNPNYEIGQVIDSLNQVAVCYNGGVRHIGGRNVVDGYNVGLKYQCVEFVKRYYLEHYNHKMPDSYGHAKSFYDPDIKDGDINKRRDLTQFSNPGSTKPKVGDLIVMRPSRTNKFGHVGIVSEVTDKDVEMIQQNGGTFASTRVRFGLGRNEGEWWIENERVLGWLRK